MRIEVAHQFHDLVLHGDIECGRGLVGNQKRRLVGDGRYGQRPLAHAAGELVRIGASAFLRIADPDK